jgi:hypothetical protein
MERSRVDEQYKERGAVRQLELNIYYYGTTQDLQWMNNLRNAVEQLELNILLWNDAGMINTACDLELGRYFVRYSDSYCPPPLPDAADYPLCGHIGGKDFFSLFFNSRTK